MRHFPVQQAMPSGWMTAADLYQWREKYDASEPMPGEIDLGSHVWPRCISSDLKRAFITAQAAHAGEISQTSLLREPVLNQFRTGKLLLPFWLWKLILRLSWFSGHRAQRSVREDFERNIKVVADLLERDAIDTLVVSHAGVMLYLRAELLKRGFTGPKFKWAENAKLYVFEKG